MLEPEKKGADSLQPGNSKGKSVLGPLMLQLYVFFILFFSINIYIWSKQPKHVLFPLRVYLYHDKTCDTGIIVWF